MSKKKWMRGGVVVAVLCMTVLMLNSVFCAETPEEAALFTDVKQSDWFYEDVVYVKNKNLMNGTGEKTFSPVSPTTRGMLVTVLWRMEGSPVAETEVQFADVAPDAFYRSAVAWATEKGVAGGYSSASFGPEDAITREQMAAVFYRYAAYKKYDVSGRAELEGFADAVQISDYAVEAMQWANAGGIITGTSAVTLEPKGKASRAQTAAILRRFDECVTASAEVQEEKPAEEPVRTPKPAGGSSVSGRPGKVVGDTGGQDTPVEEKPEEKLPALRTGNAKAKPGETVQIPVEVKNNPGILGMILNLEYDDSTLWLESVANGEAVSDVLTMTPSKTLGSGARFVWDGLEIAPEDVRDGVVLLLNFKIADTAVAGKYSINFGYAAGDIIDNMLSSIFPQIEQGYIMVEEY